MRRKFQILTTVLLSASLFFCPVQSDASTPTGLLMVGYGVLGGATVGLYKIFKHYCEYKNREAIRQQNPEDSILKKEFVEPSTKYYASRFGHNLLCGMIGSPFITFICGFTCLSLTQDEFLTESMFTAIGGTMVGGVLSAGLFGN